MAAHYLDKNNDWFLSFQAKYDNPICHEYLFYNQIIPMYQLLKQGLTEVDIVIPEDFEQKEINAIATPKIKLSNQNKAVVMLNPGITISTSVKSCLSN
jgi:hypothetical protein